MGHFYIAFRVCGWGGVNNRGLTTIVKKFTFTSSTGTIKKERPV